jgi:glycerol uptake facilitator-like aquaporin
MVKMKELQQFSVELLAECFATCILILIDEGGIANYKFARHASHLVLVFIQVILTEINSPLFILF